MNDTTAIDRRGRPMPMRERLRAYVRLMRLDRPIGSLLLLWGTLWALWIAGEGRPEPRIVAIFVVGVLVTRSAGCVMNDYADRGFDPHVARTRSRPLASGTVSPREAIGLLVTLGAVALALVLMLNRLTIVLSLVGVALALSYPFMKRLTHWPQAYLGVAFGWAVPMAFSALTGEVPIIAWVILTTVVVWSIAFDTMYAMVDRDDDVYIGVKSTAILFGGLDRLFVGAAQLATLALLVTLGAMADLGAWYAAGIGIAAVLCLWQQHLIRDRDPTGCFRAFLNNNWLGAAVFVGIVADYALTGPA
jgi:4-hydroxybenzoate polyprenyltransferase